MGGAFATPCAGPIKQIHSQRICVQEISQIQRVCKNKTENYAQEATRLFTKCTKKMRNAINKAENQFTDITGKQVSFYGDYLRDNYKQDIETYPQLDKFKPHLNDLKNKLNAFSKRRGDFLRGSITHTRAGSVLFEAQHPHFKNPGFVERYAKALAKAIKESKCNPYREKTQNCIADLEKQLKEDSKTGPQYYCRKVLQEGQVCCSNPNKKCGNFAFAKEITSTFAKSVPGLLSSFAQFRGIQGNAQAACKLSALGNVITPVGQLQINSCNKALEGCMETCNKRIEGFKAAFRSCFNINKGEIAKVVRKARDEEWKEPDHPQYECRKQIRKIAAAYKEITIEQKISLRDNSDHEDLIACRRGIERHAPSKGQGMLPAQQLAVNMCYDNLRRQNPNIPSPPRLPGTPPPSGPRSPAAGFAGSAPRTNISSFSPRRSESPRR